MLFKSLVNRSNERSVKDVPVFVITRRVGFTVYHCEMSPKIYQPTKLTHSELYCGGDFVHRAAMKQPVSCLHGTEIQYFHVVRDDA